MTENPNQFEWTSDTWKVADAYFDQSSTVWSKHQTESYNDFIERIVPMTIEQHNPIQVYGGWDENTRQYNRKYEVSIQRTYMSKPLIQESNQVIRELLPSEARERNFTYAGTLFLDISQKFYRRNPADGEMNLQASRCETRVPICKIPVMLRSKFCYLHDKSPGELKEMGENSMEQGGYFIVSGTNGASEKVLISQERMCDRKVYCFKQSKEKYLAVCEVKSTIDQRFHPVKNIAVKLTKESSGRKSEGLGKTVRVVIPYMKQEIPLFVVFRALGVIPDKEIYRCVLYDLDNADPTLFGLLDNSQREALEPPLPKRARRTEEEEPDVFAEMDEKPISVRTQQDALEYMARFLNFSQAALGKTVNPKDLPKIRVDFVKNTLNREFLPHVGQDDFDKAQFLGYMTRKMLDCFSGRRAYDDRDHSSNKRVDLAGPLLTQLFRANYQKLVKEIKNNLQKNIDSLGGIDNSMRKTVQSSSIETKIKYGLSTGNWATTKMAGGSATKKGIAQVLNRLSYLGSVSHVRRIQTPLERAGSKLIPPRRYHGTQVGYICPNETPEGAQVGVVKNMAAMCTITNDTSPIPVQLSLKELGVRAMNEVVPAQKEYGTLVFLNGALVGVCLPGDTHRIVKGLKVLRRHGVLNPSVSISWMIDVKELVIWCDGGRYSRPVLIVENNRLVAATRAMTDRDFLARLRAGTVTWNQLLRPPEDIAGTAGPARDPCPEPDATLENGAVVEFLDTNESETAMIAFNDRDLRENSPDNPEFLTYSHCEIHPMMWLGVMGFIIPFSDHNQSPRNCYQASMGKQAMGLYVPNINERADVMAHVLCYPQIPLVANRTNRYTHIDRLPHGQQTIVAVACYSGYNQEDSVIMSQNFIERGGLNSLFMRTYRDEEEQHKSPNGLKQEFRRPDPLVTRDLGNKNYDLLDDKGLVKIWSQVDGRRNDVLIGKVVQQREDPDNTGKLYKDVSTVAKHNEKGVVDMITPMTSADNNTNGDGYRYYKARVTDLRQPIIGDKVASRSAQKGTIGMVYRQEDMPFTESGIVPDLIMNPHALPSRMTWSHVLETVCGKACALSGSYLDSTPFCDFQPEDTYRVLESSGFERYGNEVMYNGMTGEQLQVAIFIGPTYYQRLKHLVEDKIHARSTGPVQLLTRQPAEGRSREGGLRLGEMERDCLLSSGLSMFLKQKSMDNSDMFRVYVSKKYQGIVVANPDKGIYRYNDKDLPEEDVVEIQCPWSNLLVFREINSMGIDTRFVTEDVEVILPKH
ncbi:MAG: DNA-directed RNA polymerase subunit beta [Sulfobacillus sp.]